jgi:predicted permease
MAWKYQELLNQNLQILLVMGVGAVCAVTRTFNQQADLAVFNKIVFKILLPTSVVLGLGLKSDLKDGATWRFIGAFLMMRAISLLACAALFGGGLRRSLGEVSAAAAAAAAHFLCHLPGRHTCIGCTQVTMSWLNVSWVSTVILGVPLVKAALGAQFANLGVVAGISSFIFQLPLMLVALEMHAGRRAAARDLPEAAAADGQAAPQLADPKALPPPPPPATAAWLPSRAQLQNVGRRLVGNAILWAILVGLVLSLSGLGPKYLSQSEPRGACSSVGQVMFWYKRSSIRSSVAHFCTAPKTRAAAPPAPPNCSYAPGAGFIALLLSSLAACTEPVALRATGVFLARRNPLACGALQAALYMLAKLVAVPALMVGCAAAAGLEGAPARAAVLLASLPVSAAAFALAKTYGVGEEAVLANVFLGNLLVLPTTLLWFTFMDGVGLFPAPAAPAAANLCAAGAAAAPKGL